MKRVAKILAVVLFLVIVAGVSRSVVKTFAAGPPKIGIIRANCQINVAGQTCPVPDVDEDGDINIKNRKFAQLAPKPGDPSLKLVKTCAAALDPTLGEPKMCTMFEDNRVPKFTSLFAVGQLNKSSQAELAPPHLAGMQTDKGEDILVPSSGYQINDIKGNPYEAMVIYADDDSITLKYTDYDDFRDPGADGGGYAIHIIGIDVDDTLLTTYRNLNKGGREFLPGVLAGDVIGKAKGDDILVSIRDTGQFMDPRWRESWWAGCSEPTETKAGVTHKPTKYETTSMGGVSSTQIHTSQSNTDDCPINPGGGSGSGGTNNGTNGTNGKALGVTFPPLHSLQACPAEIPTVGEIGNTPKPIGGVCSQTEIPEPEGCTNVQKLLSDKNYQEEFCSGNGALIRLCYPENKGDFRETGFECPHKDTFQGDPLQNYGQITKSVCNGESADPNGDAAHQSVYATYQMLKSCVSGKEPTGVDEIAPNTKESIARCMTYYKWRGDKINTGNLPVTGGNKQLPACVPTANSDAKCVSECSSPINVEESLRLYNGPILGCINSRDCVLKINLEQDKIALPFAKGLADYFSGYLDAGGVANGTMSQEELDDIQEAIINGDITQSESYDKIKTGFKAAGVAKKILPSEVQDQLKCKFINYVKEKVTANPPKNTKYYFKNKAGEMEMFKIRGVAATSVKMPPYINNQTSSCLVNNLSNTTGWTIDLKKIWNDVPLFPDDDAQGEVQFVAPSLYSSKVAGGDPDFPNNDLGSIYVSIPDIQRLNAATNALQAAIIPGIALNDRTLEITSGQYPPTIGKPINIATTAERLTAGLNACRATPDWNDYYDDKIKKQTEENTSQTEYERGVQCLVGAINQPPYSELCVVGPDGQIFCYREDEGTAPSAGKLVTTSKSESGDDYKVQVRTVFPYLFDIAEQVISPATGVLRIFKVEAEQKGLAQQFEDAFNPIPAASDKIKYKIDNVSGATVTANEPEEGWRLFFYKLGGVWNAQQFVINMLNFDK